MSEKQTDYPLNRPSTPFGIEKNKKVDYLNLAFRKERKVYRYKNKKQREHRKKGEEKNEEISKE